MKTTFFSLLIFISSQAFAQFGGVGINSDGSDVHPNAMLDIRDTSRGLLMPRLTTQQRLAINLQEGSEGLIVYDINLAAFYYHNGQAWQAIQTTASKTSESELLERINKQELEIERLKKELATLKAYINKN